MATTYSWVFSPLDAAPSEGDLEDVVKTVHWRLNGVTDDEVAVTGTIYGTISPGDADADSFTAFADLTEDIVKGWVLAQLVEEDETTSDAETRLQNQVQAQIDSQKSPAAVSKAAPWAA